MAVLNKMFTSRDEADKSQLDLNMVLTVKLRRQFPDLLEDVMAKIVPRLEMIKAAILTFAPGFHGTGASGED